MNLLLNSFTIVILSLVIQCQTHELLLNSHLGTQKIPAKRRGNNYMTIGEMSIQENIHQGCNINGMLTTGRDIPKNSEKLSVICPNGSTITWLGYKTLKEGGVVAITFGCDDNKSFAVVGDTTSGFGEISHTKTPINYMEVGYGTIQSIKKRHKKHLKSSQVTSNLEDPNTKYQENDIFGRLVLGNNEANKNVINYSCKSCSIFTNKQWVSGNFLGFCFILNMYNILSKSKKTDQRYILGVGVIGFGKSSGNSLFSWLGARISMNQLITTKIWPECQMIYSSRSGDASSFRYSLICLGSGQGFANLSFKKNSQGGLSSISAYCIGSSSEGILGIEGTTNLFDNSPSTIPGTVNEISIAYSNNTLSPSFILLKTLDNKKYLFGTKGESSKSVSYNGLFIQIICVEVTIVENESFITGIGFFFEEKETKHNINLSPHKLLPRADLTKVFANQPPWTLNNMIISSGQRMGYCREWSGHLVIKGETFVFMCYEGENIEKYRIYTNDIGITGIQFWCSNTISEIPSWGFIGYRTENSFQTYDSQTFDSLYNNIYEVHFTWSSADSHPLGMIITDSAGIHTVNPSIKSQKSTVTSLWNRNEQFSKGPLGICAKFSDNKQLLAIGFKPSFNVEAPLEKTTFDYIQEGIRCRGNMIIYKEMHCSEYINSLQYKHKKKGHFTYTVTCPENQLLTYMKLNIEKDELIAIVLKCSDDHSMCIIGDTQTDFPYGSNKAVIQKIEVSFGYKKRYVKKIPSITLLKVESLKPHVEFGKYYVRGTKEIKRVWQSNGFKGLCFGMKLLSNTFKSFHHAKVSITAIGVQIDQVYTPEYGAMVDTLPSGRLLFSPPEYINRRGLWPQCQQVFGKKSSLTKDFMISCPAEMNFNVFKMCISNQDLSVILIEASCSNAHTQLPPIRIGNRNGIPCTEKSITGKIEKLIVGFHSTFGKISALKVKATGFPTLSSLDRHNTQDMKLYYWSGSELNMICVSIEGNMIVGFGAYFKILGDKDLQPIGIISNIPGTYKSQLKIDMIRSIGEVDIIRNKLEIESICTEWAKSTEKPKDIFAIKCPLGLYFTYLILGLDHYHKQIIQLTLSCGILDMNGNPVSKVSVGQEAHINNMLSIDLIQIALLQVSFASKPNTMSITAKNIHGNTIHSFQAVNPQTNTQFSPISFAEYNTIESNLNVFCVGIKSDTFNMTRHEIVSIGFPVKSQQEQILSPPNNGIGTLQHSGQHLYNPNASLGFFVKDMDTIEGLLASSLCQGWRDLTPSPLQEIKRIGFKCRNNGNINLFKVFAHHETDYVAGISGSCSTYGNFHVGEISQYSKELGDSTSSIKACTFQWTENYNNPASVLVSDSLLRGYAYYSSDIMSSKKISKSEFQGSELKGVCFDILKMLTNGLYIYNVGFIF
ncbi:hypothetical protein cand_012530 [Cryptosporidium andersoni]|uniref:LCCL domain-containing protein n=1 Tax=Cryptosporidium andersoni TaxID=117008 RepID=A0A1J4ME85_9CRYT|nr:hypothetical protein cand_012530 [Cryptosporidium andersoni]